MCSCCCCCCSAALVVVVSATVCFIFMIFLYSLVFFLHFSSMSFPSLSSNSCAHKRTNFSMRIHTHISTRTHSHTHAHARTHTKGYVVGSFVVYRLLVLFFIDFFLRCAFAAVWFANAAKIAIKCSFYQFHSLSLSLALFLLLLSLAWRRNCKLPHATLTPTALPWALSSVN